MGAPVSLLGQARAFARDFPRDRMPPQYLWDVVDYVPLIIDASLTGRGGWQWGSTAMGGDPVAGILAPYPTGEKVLAIGSNATLYEVDQNSPYTATARGGAWVPKQNPIMVVNSVVNFDGNGANVPQLITAPGGTVTIAQMNANAPKARYGTSWRGYLVVGGTPGEDNVVRFQPVDAIGNAWDTQSYIASLRTITGLASLRAVTIIFHAGTVERLRGASPPRSTGQGDMDIEPLFDRAGCGDARTIAYWQDNVVFADEHGVHVTDGAVVRNLCSQGGILYYWRTLWGNRTTVAATTFLDYYIITVRQTTGPAVTLVCDLTKRQWFRFANVYALSYFASGGTIGMERVWAGMAGSSKLARIGPTFFPALQTTLNVDADGQPVLPVFETPWYRRGVEGRKRTRFAYVSYDATTAVRPADDIPPAPGELISTLTPVLELDYVVTPQRLTYTSAGRLPETSKYQRYRLPVNRLQYGVAFRVKQLTATTVTRIYDLAVEDFPVERSRV